MSESKKMKFRLRERCGPHIEGVDAKTELLVMPGEVFESATDRSRTHPEKFERLPDDMRVTARGLRPTLAPVAPLPETTPEAEPNPVQKAAEIGALEAMTLDELRKWAASEEIDVRKAKTRDEALKIIKDAMA